MFGNGRYPDPRVRLEAVVTMMREVSLETDPQKLVMIYGKRMAEFLSSDGYLSISRRNLQHPYYRVTRSSKWGYGFDPWLERDKLPVLKGGLLADLIYSDQPHMLEVFRFPEDDPAFEFVPEGCKFLVAIPHYDRGLGLNYVFHFFKSASAFDVNELPEMVWMSNLFGRGVNNLALSRDLKLALSQLDRELKVVEEMQRMLLPQDIPNIPTLRLAAHYQTSRHAGGDYYDFFDLNDDNWGLLLADVSGHGTPAAVIMAVTHALAHNYPGNPTPPGLMLHYLNRKLCSLPTSVTGNFVTAVYANYNARTRVLTYGSAGHPESRLVRLNDQGQPQVLPLREGKALPLGIHEGEQFSQGSVQLRPGDRLCFYTDGITENFDRAGNMFGTPGLDDALLRPATDPQDLINHILESVGAFTGNPRGEDDRTVITAMVT